MLETVQSMSLLAIMEIVGPVLWPSRWSTALFSGREGRELPKS
jgi:hypothetical protein